MDKELKKVLEKLQKDYTEVIANVEAVGEVKRLILTSPQLNYIFGGGFPLGRIVEFYGPESGGKTVLSCYIGAEFQKRPTQNVVLFIDMEHAFEKNYAQTVGLDINPEKFIFLRPLTGEEAFTITEELVKTGKIGLIIWDSIASTPTSAMIDSEYSKACVSPETEIVFKIIGESKEKYSISLRNLFYAAGYKNPHLLTPGTKYLPQKHIEALSFNSQTQKMEWKRVTGLFYKGLCDISNSYQIFIPQPTGENKSFYCTGEHLFYNADTGKYESVKKLFPSFTALDVDGKPIKVRIAFSEHSFPILDIEVHGNQNYFSSGILSHNSFGGTAKLFSEGLRKLNPYLSRYQTSMILLNQVRDDIGGFSPVPGMKLECVAPDTQIDVWFE